MAMTPRNGSVRPQAKAGPIYEDFKPKIKWKHEDDPEIILIYLPGFTEERLKVTTESQNVVRIQGERLIAGNKWSQNTVKVRGERPIVGSKWSRFKEDLQIPEHCKTRGILAQFEGGILTITMPRKISVTQSTAQKGKAHTTQATLAPQKTYPLPTPLSLKKVATGEKSRKGMGKQPNGDGKQATSAENVGQQKGDNGETKGKPNESKICRNAMENTKLEEKKNSSDKINEPKMAKEMKENQETKEKPIESYMPQKPMENGGKRENKEISETKDKPSESKMSQKATEKVKNEERNGRHETKWKPDESKMSQKATKRDEKEENKEINETKREPSEPKMQRKATEKDVIEEEPNRIEKGKEPTDRVENDSEKNTEKIDISISCDCGEKTGRNSKAKVESENYRQMVNDEREWMVNMGVATLVIVAFGVFGYYTSRSSKH